MGDTGFGGVPNGMDRTNIAYMLWEKQYVFVRAMLPRFINEEFGRKVGRFSQSLRQMTDLGLLSRSSRLERASTSFATAAGTANGPPFNPS